MNREKEIYKVTLIGSAGNLALLIFKFVAGVVGHSAAMMADAFHSLSDFFTDIIVLLFVKVSERPQDVSHEYGHGKFETLATLFIGLALVGVAIGVIVNGAIKFASWLSGESLPSPGKLALWAALVSILVKEALYRYTIIQGRSLESKAVIANAWHHRSDALSSVGAAIGIGGAIIFGERWAVLDPLASIVIGGMLMKVAWDLLKDSLGELTDQSLTEAEEQEILSIISSSPNVTEPHNLRTRHIGKRIAIEFHIRLDGSLSLETAHSTATEIERKLKERFGSDAIVTIHMEPRKQAPVQEG